MNKFHKAAIEYKRAVHGKINLEQAVKYAKSIGFTTVFFSSCDDEIFVRYNLVDVARTAKAFTYNGLAHVIFINDTLSYTQKLHRILHELGHITLKHLGGEFYLQNSDETEAEAESFVYAILYDKHFGKPSHIFYILIAASFLFCALTGYGLFCLQKTPASSPGYTNNDTIADTVYVTPSGTKFHRAQCRYTDNKKCIALTRAEAENKYSPCSVCLP